MADNYYFGIHAIEALLANKPDALKQLFMLDGDKNPRLDQLRQAARRAGVPVQSTKRAQLDNMTNKAVHQGVVADCRLSSVRDEASLHGLVEKTDVPFLLILDEIQDPHNLGACLRTADAAGVHGVIITKHGSAGLTPVVRKVACGAAEMVPVFQVTNLKRTMAALKKAGVWCYGLAGEATESVLEADLSGARAIVMGSEGVGLRLGTREACDKLLSIPMQGSVSSLNVSVATGVALFACVK